MVQKWRSAVFFQDKMQPKPTFNINFLKVLCGSSLITIGVLLIINCTTIFNYVLDTAYAMYPGSFAFNMWRKYPMSLSIAAYVWNWTNPQDIYNHSVKPNFVQMGPYVFDEDKIKMNITWNFHNNTITYRQRRIWHFNREKSVGPMTDQFTTLNPVSMSAAHKIRDWGYFMKKGFSFSLSAMSQKLHVTKSVGETLFQGYEDPLMKLAKNMPYLIGDDVNFEITNKFAWFLPRNNSEIFDGIFNMGTGGTNRLGEMLKWNYKDVVDIHEGECSRVHGSAGEYYPPLENAKTISFWSPEICQNIKLDYAGLEKWHGITGKKFSAGPSFLDNGTIVPENKCYCDGECVPYGAVNASACRYGTPAFITLPHFYKADHSYLDKVEGMKPDKENHDFFLSLEPRTRIPLRAKARLQLNLLLHPIQSITVYERAPRIFFPILWFEQCVDLPGSLKVMLNFLLVLETTTIVIGSVFVTIGLSLLGSVMYKELNHRYSRIHAKRTQTNHLEKSAYISKEELKKLNNKFKLRKETFQDIPMYHPLEKSPFISTGEETAPV